MPTAEETRSTSKAITPAEEETEATKDQIQEKV
jgi:hypothetical protein